MEVHKKSCDVDELLEEGPGSGFVTVEVEEVGVPNRGARWTHWAMSRRGHMGMDEHGRIQGHGEHGRPRDSAGYCWGWLAQLASLGGWSKSVWLCRRK
jgi:hypothetical protein